MLPQKVINATSLHNVFKVASRRADITVSRNRDVTILNKGLDEDGIYIFKRDKETNLYKGTVAYGAALAFIRIQQLYHAGVLNKTPNAKVFKAEIDPAKDYLPDGFRKIIETFLEPAFSKDVNVDFGNYVFEIKATEKVKQDIVRVTTELTSLHIQQQFISPNTLGDEIPEDDMFVAYIFHEQVNGYNVTVLIDIGELWDEGIIDINDLQNILTAYPKNSKTFLKAPGLTDKEREEMVQRHNAISKTKAFDDIMKEHNPDFNSNLEG